MARILVVDDDPILPRLVSLMLRHGNHEVVAVESGKAAIDYLTEDYVDLIIVDLMMPEVSGMTLIRELRSAEPYQQLPIIVFTASGRWKDQEQALQLGINGFLNKPTSSWELTETVNYALGY